MVDKFVENSSAQSIATRTMHAVHQSQHPWELAVVSRSTAATIQHECLTIDNVIKM